MGGLNTALQVAKDLRLSKIFGGSDKARALNYYSEAVSYYNGQIKFMWNEKKKSQGLLLYFSATGFKAWQNLEATVQLLIVLLNTWFKRRLDLPELMLRLM